MYKRVVFIFLTLAELIKNGIHGNESCAISLNSTEYVKSCPSNEVEMEKSSKRKNCSQYIDEDAKGGCSDYRNIKYHCVINEDGDKLIEVCAPERVIKGFCAEFNNEGGKVKDNYYLECTGYSQPCPNPYNSTDIYLYQDCYNLESNIKRIQDEKLGYQITTVKESTVTSKKSYSTTTQISVPDWLVTVVCSSIIFVSSLVFFVVLFSIQLKKCKDEGDV